MGRRRVIGFYTEGRGRRRKIRPITSRRRSLRIRRSRSIFFPPRHKKYAEIVKVDTPANARESVQKLEAEFRTADRRKKRLIKRVTVLAATRARVMSANDRLSPEQRREAAEVARIYQQAAERMVL
jgi:hypothetical protein